MDFQIYIKIELGTLNYIRNVRAITCVHVPCKCKPSIVNKSAQQLD